MKNHAISSLSLRIIQGGIADHHPLRDGSHSGIRNRGQTDACRGTDLPGLDRKGMPLDAISQPLRKRTSPLPIRMGQHDHECVTSVSTDDIDLTHRRPYQIGSRSEYVISCRMTETIVYGLKKVQIQKHQASWYTIPQSSFQLSGKRRVKPTVV
jgi:hypothetical protein